MCVCACVCVCVQRYSGRKIDFDVDRYELI